jgi:sugar phosphate isomerase/epimerase
MSLPRIYLVLDNCFAIKRWVRPAEWMSLINRIGFRYAQASTDNEIDPLFAPEEYMDDWFDEVRINQRLTGVKVANFYTGYQTYRTVGIAHHDTRVRKKLMEGWLKRLIRRLATLENVGLGFSFFAIPDEELQDPDKYQRRTELILSELRGLASFAYENGQVQVSFEQMYAPHQPPWTIEGAKYYLRRIYESAHKPLYVTLDVGHMVGQRHFLRPTIEQIEESLMEAKSRGHRPQIWLGSDSAYEKWYRAVGTSATSQKAIQRSAQEISLEMDRYPYLFAREEDGDVYAWVEELACYSPIIHMQQTDGLHSSHAAFTQETNANGIVTGERLLRAIARSYQRDPESGMPPRVNDIYLSFEIFSANIEKKVDIIWKLKETLEYWRKYIPEDGMRLDEVLALL